MATELELHPIQADILLVLLFKPRAKFSELNTTKISSDHFAFHLKRLVKGGFILRNNDETYSLTAKGKEFANRFDTDSVVVERQAKVAVLVCSIKTVKGKTYYLIQQRLKEPYYGFYGFLTGKIRWGETILESASRELKEETGLSGKLELVGVKHKMDYLKAKEGDLLEDKYFFVVRAKNLHGKFIEKFTGGKNLWLTEKDIGNLPVLFDGVEETINMVKQNEFIFNEAKYKVSKY